MNKEINERIETIKKGNVPNGYIRTKAGLMPCDWIKSKPLTTNMIFENISDKNHGDEYPVLSATQEKGIVLRSEIEKDINFNKENTNSYKLVCKGDYVISLRSFQGGIEYSNMDGLVSPAYTVIRPIIPISDGYYKEYFKTNDFIDRLNSTIYGIRDGKQIGYKDFAELVLHNPPLEEQEKIAEILSWCDTVIEECKKQMEEYKSLKKTCLNKMFPKKGSNTPEIRFPGFTDAWEQRKLGELGKMKNGMNFSKESMGIGFPLVNLQNVFGNNVIDCSNLGKAMASPAQLREYSLKKGDVLFVRSSVKLEGVGEAALVPKNLENTTYSGFIIRFRDDTGLNDNFKKYVFSTEPIRIQIMSHATDSANKNISQSVLSNLDVFIPSTAEQEKIGKYFEHLDNLINLYQHKVETYSQMKKALTQLLLTGIVRVNKQQKILP